MMSFLSGVLKGTTAFGDCGEAGATAASEGCSAKVAEGIASASACVACVDSEGTSTGALTFIRRLGSMVWITWSSGVVTMRTSLGPGISNGADYLNQNLLVKKPLPRNNFSKTPCPLKKKKDLLWRGKLRCCPRHCTVAVRSCKHVETNCGGPPLGWAPDGSTTSPSPADSALRWTTPSE